MPAMLETWVWSLDWEDPLEKGMAMHSIVLAWRIPWMEISRYSPGVTQSWTWLRGFHFTRKSNLSTPLIWNPFFFKYQNSYTENEYIHAKPPMLSLLFLWLFLFLFLCIALKMFPVTIIYQVVKKFHSFFFLRWL